MTTAHIRKFARDFDKTTLSQLTRKGLAIVGRQAIPDYPGDPYFSGVAYTLTTRDDHGFIRKYDQIKVMARSSWTVKDLGT